MRYVSLDYKISNILSIVIKFEYNFDCSISILASFNRSYIS